jgi:hypothetical protein
MIAAPTIAQEIIDRLGPAAAPQETHDHTPTFWSAPLDSESGRVTCSDWPFV